MEKRGVKGDDSNKAECKAISIARQQSKRTKYNVKCGEKRKMRLMSVVLQIHMAIVQHRKVVAIQESCFGVQITGLHSVGTSIIGNKMQEKTDNWKGKRCRV